MPVHLPDILIRVVLPAYGSVPTSTPPFLHPKTADAQLPVASSQNKDSITQPLGWLAVPYD